MFQVAPPHWAPPSSVVSVDVLWREHHPEAVLWCANTPEAVCSLVLRTPGRQQPEDVLWCEHLQDVLRWMSE